MPRRKEPRKATQADCAGCRNDFYNSGEGAGLAPAGKCWSLDTAVMQKMRLVHINTSPRPNKQGAYGFDHVKPELLPSCYHKPQFVRVKVEP